jgi:rhamnopyranosyl-N-acetylglucosaminyl-diphospho-decaprenol beta-1,3/1,4-galactofuranosyltransferase
MTLLRVAAVVVTYNRSAVLAETLRAVQAQTRPPDGVYVVDNASNDGTADLLRSDFPDVAHLRMAENVGPCGGQAHGIETARTDGFDAFWLMDDDSRAERDALSTLLGILESRGRQAGIVGCRGGLLRFGLVRHLDDRRLRRDRRGVEGPTSVDFVLLDGSLVSGRVVDAVGVPPASYFSMMEDVEYPLRARRAGFEVLVTNRDLMQREHLGSAPGTALWRSYYQSRNHVRLALDFRSPSLLFGCAARQARFLVAAVRAPDRRWQRLKLRSRGVWDGALGRMGRRVEPDAPSQ